MRGWAGAVLAVASIFPAATSGTWSTAHQVPGVSLEGESAVYTAPAYLGASCSSSQNCTVAYIASGNSSSGPVLSVTSHDGRWAAPRRIPGLRAEPGLQLALACSSGGDCVVAATAPLPGTAIMVARLSHGAWSLARPVPGQAGLHAADSIQISALACGRTGWCALAGQYQPPGRHSAIRPFVATAHNGSWSAAHPIPALAALTGTWASGVDTISCVRATCAAAGYYRDQTLRLDESFAVTETAGQWGQARPITGIGRDGSSFITAMSCSAAGNCSAAGTYNTSTATQLMTVTQTAGTWHRATPLRGQIPLSYPADAQNITALTCTAPGQCVALGAYGASANSTDGAPVRAVPFSAAQAHGTWSAIRAIRGLPTDAVAWVTSVSCATAGNCAAGGYYFTNPNGDEHSMSNYHGFLVTERRGTWGRAQLVPGLKPLGSRASTIDGVFCQVRQGCSAIGDYFARGRHLFTTTQG